MSVISFVILSHSDPEQLLQLTTRIGSMFPDARIVCAHDFGQAPLDPGRYPNFVSFVRPHVSTRWGHISIAHAVMHGVRKLYDEHDPDWFVLLSGSDYPVVTAETILSELKTSNYDAYLDHRDVTSRTGWAPSPLDYQKSTYAYDRAAWVPLAYDRYVAKAIRYPWVTERLRPTRRWLYVRQAWLIWPFHPFRSDLRCFAGDTWFTANRRVARALLEEYENGERLIRHFSKRWLPEEAFFQTMICNRSGLRISGDNKRYADWSLGGPHPKFLDIDDIPAITASGAHFARKFRLGSSALSLLDRVIDKK